MFDIGRLWFHLYIELHRILLQNFSANRLGSSFKIFLIVLISDVGHSVETRFDHKEWFFAKEIVKSIWATCQHR